MMRRQRLAEGVVVAAIAVGAVVAYAWDLDVQGWANPYYAAIVQTGAQSWHSFLFGSLELGNAVASDKPPLAFWVMGLSARLFGLSSWSVLLPQALETVAAVLVLYRAVREVSGRVAATVAALLFACTPVVLVLARYDHPDTLMTFLVVAAAYCCLRATRSPRRRWVVATGVLLGLAFLSKWAVALLPAPAFAAALAMARVRPGARRLPRLVLLGSVTALTAMSWVVAVQVLPARLRPYADGSQGNLLSLIVGRDGLSRLGGSAGTGAVEAAGRPGVWRLLAPPFGPQIGWFLPLAVAVLAIVTVLAVRERATSPGWVLFGGWFVTGASVFTVMTGPMYPYYTALLAPAQAAVIGIGVAELRRRRRLALLAVPVVLTLVYQLYLARHLALPAALVAAAALLGVASVWGLARASVGRVVTSGAVRPALVVAPLLLLPVGLGVGTLSHPVTGNDPLAGTTRMVETPAYPSAVTTFLRSHLAGRLWLAAVPRATAASLLQLQSGAPVLPLGGFTGHASAPTLAEIRTWVDQDRLRYVLLPHGYTGFANDTPPSLAGFPVAPILAWARHTGCPQRVGSSQFVVLDLDTEAPCRS